MYFVKMNVKMHVYIVQLEPEKNYNSEEEELPSLKVLLCQLLKIYFFILCYHK